MKNGRRSGLFRTLFQTIDFAIEPRAALLFTLAFLTAFTMRAQEVKPSVPDNIAPHSAPEQPIPYSHKTHLAMDLKCPRCHTNPAPGNQMTFPATSTCMSCHAAIAKEKPSIVKLTGFAKSGQPIPWVRVYEITPGVNWSHRKHLDAGMQCAMCHGDVTQQDAMSEITAVTSMASCINCHMAHNAGTTCGTCHPWPRNLSN